MRDGELLDKIQVKPIEFELNQGTGSWPQPPHGWHLIILLKANQLPLIGPYFWMASTAYCEHVGVKRQLGPNNGDIKIW